MQPMAFCATLKLSFFSKRFCGNAACKGSGQAKTWRFWFFLAYSLGHPKGSTHRIYRALNRSVLKKTSCLGLASFWLSFRAIRLCCAQTQSYKRKLKASCLPQNLLQLIKHHAAKHELMPNWFF